MTLGGGRENWVDEYPKLDSMQMNICILKNIFIV